MDEWQLLPKPPAKPPVLVTALPVGVPKASAGPLAVSGPPAPCWRYAEGQWRKLPADMAMGACVQTLFAGRCERPGGGAYGRWGGDTLRLIPGKVEISGDNHTFRTLVEPWPGCPAGPPT